MYAVSDKYIEQMEKPVRNQSHARVIITMGDEELTSLSASGTNMASFCDLSDIADANAEMLPYFATFEQAKYVLSGSSGLAIYGAYEEGGISYDGQTTYNGFVSSNVSNASGNFLTYPALTLTFDSQKIEHFTLIFDYAGNDHPAHIRVQLRAPSGSWTPAEAFDITSSRFQYTNGYANKYATGIRITFTKTISGYRRARLDKVLFGNVKIFEDGDIVSCKITQDFDIISTRLPKCSFELQFYDLHGEYLPDATPDEGYENYYEALKPGTPIAFSVGYELDDGTIEWVPYTPLFLTGVVSTGLSGGLPGAKITATDRLGSLEKVDEKFSAQVQTFYEMVMNTAEHMGVAEYMKLNQMLSESKTAIYPTEGTDVPVNQFFLKVANAITCVLLCDRDGDIHIDTLEHMYQDSYVKGVVMGYSKMIGSMSITKYDAPGPIRISYTDAFRAPKRSVSEYVEVSGNAGKTSQINYRLNNTYVDGSARKYNYSDWPNDADFSVSNAVVYAKNLVATVHGNGTINVSGRGPQLTPNTYQYYTERAGAELSVSNPLVTYLLVLAYKEWINEMMSLVEEYSAQDRGYPEIDVCDVVKLQVADDTYKHALVISRTLTFNGAISGSGRYLILDNEVE